MCFYLYLQNFVEMTQNFKEWTIHKFEIEKDIIWSVLYKSIPVDFV